MKKLHIAIVFAVSLLTAGCSEFLDDAEGTNIDAEDVRFDFSATVEGSGQGELSDTPNRFTTFRSLTVSDIGSREVTERAGEITDIAIEETSLLVRASDGAEYLVKNLSIETDVTGSPQVIEKYLTGKEYRADWPMMEFVVRLVARLVKGDEMVVTITGNTDAPVGTRLDIDLNSEIDFEADPLKKY